MITDNELKCNFNQCNRTYHSSCLTNSNLTTLPSFGVYYCPLHVCATCHLHKRPNDSIGNYLLRVYSMSKCQFSRSSVYLFVLSNSISWSWTLSTSWFSLNLLFILSLLSKSSSTWTQTSTPRCSSILSYMWANHSRNWMLCLYGMFNDNSSIMFIDR